MAWFILLLAGIAEISWAVGLKYTNGFTKPVPSVITFVLMIISFVLLAQAVKTLPLGTAYAIWVGIGAVGTFIAGMVLFHESRDVMRFACAALVVVGVVGMRFFDTPVRPAAEIVEGRS